MQSCLLITHRQRVSEEIQLLPTFLRPVEPSCLSHTRLLLPAGCGPKAMPDPGAAEVAQGQAPVVEAPRANMEHQEKMLLRVRKFVASSTNGTKDGDAGDRKAVKMLMENGDGESLITFSTIHPASGLVHLSKGGWYSCIICNRTNKYDDGAACAAHFCGPLHIEKWLGVNVGTAESKEGLQGRMSPKWKKQRTANGKGGMKRARTEGASLLAAAAAAGTEAAINLARSGDMATPPVPASPAALATPTNCGRREEPLFTPATALADGRAIAADAMAAAASAGK